MTEYYIGFLFGFLAMLIFVVLYILNWPSWQGAAIVFGLLFLGDFITSKINALITKLMLKGFNKYK